MSGRVEGKKALITGAAGVGYFTWRLAERVGRLAGARVEIVQFVGGG